MSPNHPFAYYIQRGDFMEVVMSVVLCFFAVYGFFQILYNIACKIAKSDLCIPEKKHILICVDKNTDKLEGYIRYISMQENMDKIILLCNPECKNNPESKKLIDIICSEFDEAEVMNITEYNDYISSLMN